MSVQLDLFDLLEAPPLDTESVWEKVEALTHVYGGSSWIAILMDSDRYATKVEGSQPGRGGYYVHGRAGIWMPPRRPEDGPPDITWKQITAALKEKKAQIPAGDWWNVEVLWDRYQGTFPEISDAHNAPGYYSSDPGWWKRVRAAESAMTAAYAAFHDAFFTALDLKEHL